MRKRAWLACLALSRLHIHCLHSYYSVMRTAGGFFMSGQQRGGTKLCIPLRCNGWPSLANSARDARWHAASCRAAPARTSADACTPLGADGTRILAVHLRLLYLPLVPPSIPAQQPLYNSGYRNGYNVAPPVLIAATPCGWQFSAGALASIVRRKKGQAVYAPPHPPASPFYKQVWRAYAVDGPSRAWQTGIRARATHTSPLPGIFCLYLLPASALHTSKTSSPMTRALQHPMSHAHAQTAPHAATPPPAFSPSLSWHEGLRASGAVH